MMKEQPDTKGVIRSYWLLGQNNKPRLRLDFRFGHSLFDIRHSIPIL